MGDRNGSGGRNRGAWTVRGSRHVLRDRWIGVRADDCTTPGGVDVSPYYVLEFPDFVHVLASDAAGRFVLARQYRHGVGGASIELPGGNVDAGETDPGAAAMRELREETGYGGGHFEAVASFSPDPARYANRLHLVRARDVVPGAARPDAAEDIDVVLADRAELVRLVRTGGIVSAPHVGLILLGLSLDDEASAG